MTEIPGPASGRTAQASLRVVVLGATGALGSHAVRACLARGWAVRALVRPGSPRAALDGLDVEWVEGDVRDRDALGRAFQGCRCFVHAAGYYPTAGVSSARAVKEGLASVRGALEAARAAGVERGIYVSSATTFVTRPDRPAGATSAELAGDRSGPRLARGCRSGNIPPSRRPRGGVYSLVKERMEELALEAAAVGLPLAIVNPTFCLGEYDWKPSSGRLVLAVARGRLPFYPEGRLNLMYSGDVGRGIALALERADVGRRYLLAGDDVTLSWLVRQIAYEAGTRRPVASLPRSLARAGARLADIGARARGEPAFGSVAVELLGLGRGFYGSAAARELGLPDPTPAVETVRRAVRWFREAGLLASPGPAHRESSR